MAWYLKHYCCDACDIEWTDEHCCACNDRCPECDREIEPYDVEDAPQGSCGDPDCPDCAR